MLTPSNVDTFSRFFVDVFDEKEMIGVSTGFQAFFGRPDTGANTVFSPNSGVIDIDIIRGNEKTAALIPRGTISRPLGPNQKNMNVERFSNFARKFPLSEEEGDITADQILYRLPGENPYQRRTRLDRMRRLGLKLHNENIRRHIRLFERLASQSVRTGKQDAILGTADPDLQYDFRRNPDNIISVPVAWNNAAAVIMANIDLAGDRLRVNGKVNMDMGIFGGDAMNAFLNDDKVKELADNRRFQQVTISMENDLPQRFQRFVDAGFQLRGKLQTPKGRTIWIFTYDDVYTNEAGDPVEYMPVDQAVFTSSMARCDRYFGPPETLPMIPQRVQLYQEIFGFDPSAAPMPDNIKSSGNIIDPNMFYCDAYVAGDWKKVSVRTQSAPIYATTHTDAFVTLTDLIE
jgi:hypothetical protein